MVEVRVDPQRVERAKHLAQRGGDPLGKGDRRARADADDLDVGDGTDPREQTLQPIVGEHEGIAARDEDVADLGRALDVGEAAGERSFGEVAARIACAGACRKQNLQYTGQAPSRTRRPCRGTGG